MPVTAVRDEGALRMWVCRLPVHIGPAECTVFTGIYGEFVTSQWADRVVGPYGEASIFPVPRRGGRLCPPAGCTDFTGIFGEFTAAPYIQRGNCLRIRRKFSKEFTAFCRAEQSPAPTNCGCISTVFA